MFVVTEYQTNANGNTIVITTDYSTEAEAKSKYHQILSAAAISQVPLHGATITTGNTFQIANECYEHPVATPSE